MERASLTERMLSYIGQLFSNVIDEPSDHKFLLHSHKMPFVGVNFICIDMRRLIWKHSKGFQITMSKIKNNDTMNMR